MSGEEEAGGFLGRWLRSDLAILVVILSLLGGMVALFFTPREEEPQIDVPLIDVFVQAPGLTAGEVERRIVWPMEQTLYATRGVEYVYSSSFRDGAVITTRFYVGEDPTESAVHVRSRLERNRHRFSPELASYQIRPVYVDDVPFMTFTLHSDTVDDAELLSLAEEYLYELTSIEGVGLIFIVGGRNQAVMIGLDPQRMASRGVTLPELRRAVAGFNTRVSAGEIESRNQSTQIEVGRPFTAAEDLQELVVGRDEAGPVFLRDVARVTEEPVEARNHILFAKGPAAGGGIAPADAVSLDRAALTFALAKRPAMNAVATSAEIHERVEALRPIFSARGVEIDVTRDYGDSADYAVNWLVFSLFGASVVVMIVLAMFLGWREALIVLVAVPTTFAIALLVNYLAGFTLNRVTLFALIVALGLIVDDSIVCIENIHRYLHTSAGKGRSYLGNITVAVREVVPPMVLTSLVVVVAFVPLAFVTGLMGPYMAPMALTVPVAMLSSTAVATLIVPWLAKLVFHNEHEAESSQTDANKKVQAKEETSVPQGIYTQLVSPFLDHRGLAYGLILGLTLLFAGAAAMPFLGGIPLKLLPHDDAETLQLVVDLPEGAPLERTEGLVRELASIALRQNEVLDVTAYTGVSGPIDFNGLVRGYYLREGKHVGDIRINLIRDEHRRHSCHQIALRLWESVQPVAERYGATVKVVERPPGPPVLAPVVAEVGGPPEMPYTELVRGAERVEALFRETQGLLGVDSSMEAPAPRKIFEVDRRKAALAGLTEEELGHLVAGAIRGVDLTWMREAVEIRPRPVRIRLPAHTRSKTAVLEDLPVARVGDRVLTLGELGSFRDEAADQTIERKNLQRVIYVTGETAGRMPVEIVFDVSEKIEELRRNGELPENLEVRFDGEGEWFITRRVFRDLGIALGIAVVAIYAMLVYQTGSYPVAGILLSSIPLTLVGILPGFWLLNALLTQETAGVSVGIPFTATGMIGIVALAGIAVRNAILLIDFTQSEEKKGKSVREALLSAGTLRTRPILLTAGTAMLAVIPIAFDPVFSGLAWTLIFGLFVSTLFTLVLVPALYQRVYGD
jgi:multidrug efflux pump subunit AcrB